MIHVNIDTVRLFLHLFGVAVWVGGQTVLAGLVPAVRRHSPDVPAVMARAFARIAWPAMALIIVTGAWSLAAVDASDRTTDWVVTLAIKLVMIGLAIAATLVHSVGRSRAALAIGGAVALLGSLAATFLGVMLAHAG